MTRDEISQAVKLAKSEVDLSQHNYDIMIGFGLPEFQPVYVSLEQVAKMMRYQYCQFNGGWDDEAFNNELIHYKRNIRII